MCRVRLCAESSTDIFATMNSAVSGVFSAHNIPITMNLGIGGYHQ